VNPALGISIVLPGSWNFMEIDAYSSPEQKARAKAESETMRAHCSGPLCGEADIKEALQTANGGHPVLAIFLTAFKLSPEFRDRQSHPLFEFAQIMTSSAADNGWIVDENLMPVRLSGRHAYRLLVHNATRPDAKGVMYVADSNGFVFMLVATATQRFEDLASAVENLKFSQSQK
jgi:hypothetical protein